MYIQVRNYGDIPIDYSGMFTMVEQSWDNIRLSLKNHGEITFEQCVVFLKTSFGPMIDIYWTRTNHYVGSENTLVLVVMRAT